MCKTHHREPDCTYFGFQPATRYTRRITKEVMTSTCSPSEKKKTSDREAGQTQRDRPERDHGFTIDVTAVLHHHKYSLHEATHTQTNRDSGHNAKASSICAVFSLVLEGREGSLSMSVGLQSRTRGSLLRVSNVVDSEPTRF